ncbi:MAG: preprotein translocase subunit SecE [Candidatus Krumholzibacteria bacterium]|jgi:preprotein translocase subunit SecE|nr:preprotein translocase subunit SecE [Candidatus Krumholzibacteria bacterium]MDP6526967.1 preprotein translocase subunit SecE [Kiritimatiellia bacterium]MDP6796627.1 preprotein translocase subunit SecE [Candidatus Krumholzibacteria bacterium]MDP7022593.1 preprotein translocase subunit SecE [Candidatus Krumholzibacteria bacterium]
MIGKLRAYLREVWLEMGKVTWPTMQELKESTRVVIIATFLVTVFIFVVDRFMGIAVDGITRLLSGI